MNIRLKTIVRGLVCVGLFFSLTSCENLLSDTVDDFGEVSFVSSIEDWEGWTFDSHSEDADASYETLFDDNETTVHRLDITIDSDYYELMEEDMDELYGGRSSGFSDDDPVYVPVTVEFNDQTWWYVGMRYKGNSSLSSSYTDGVHKYPFRLDFDHFDYIYSEIDGQNFWGFEKMTFSSSYNDESHLADMMASEFFLQGGVEAAQASFCRVYIDTGDGAVYWGLYTMLEDVSDQLLSDQFTDGSGNLYKPDDEDESTLEYFSEDYYPKKTNEDEDDYSDIIELIEYVNDSSMDLTEVFDVTHYLEYLAMNNTFQNWDVYGSKAHNYYLYADPDDGERFTWIPWDMNEAFDYDSKCQSLDVKSDYDDGDFDGWPLQENLLSQSTYREEYNDILGAYFNDSGCTFDYSDMATLIQTYADLIETYVYGDDGEISGYTWLSDNYDESDYDENVQDLKDQISERISDVSAYLLTAE